jgi:hypothetical protein
MGEPLHGSPQPAKQVEEVMVTKKSYSVRENLMRIDVNCAESVAESL